MKNSQDIGRDKRVIIINFQPQSKRHYSAALKERDGRI